MINSNKEKEIVARKGKQNISEQPTHGEGSSRIWSSAGKKACGRSAEIAPAAQTWHWGHRCWVCTEGEVRWGRTSPLALDTYLRKERLRVSSKGMSSLRKYRLGADSLPGAVGRESVRVARALLMTGCTMKSAPSVTMTGGQMSESRGGKDLIRTVLG